MPCVPEILNFFLIDSWTYLGLSPAWIWAQVHSSAWNVPLYFFIQILIYQKTLKNYFGRFLQFLCSELFDFLLTLGRGFITLYFQNAFSANSVIHLFITCIQTANHSWRKIMQPNLKFSLWEFRSLRWSLNIAKKSKSPIMFL